VSEQGYGTDTYCWSQIKTGRLVTGVLLVAQALYRRLTTARGTLRDGDAGQVYGIDMQDFVGRVGTAAALALLPEIARAEILKDDRVSSANVTAATTADSAGLVAVAIKIDCELVNPGDRFELTLQVSAVSVSVLGFSEAA
jgi:hypothetical protein